MNLIQITDIEGVVHLVNLAEIVRVSPVTLPGTLGAGVAITLSTGDVLQCPITAAAFQTTLVAAAPTVTIPTQIFGELAEIS
jgi:hypothetical protein